MYQTNEWCLSCERITTCNARYPEGSINPGTLECQRCGNESRLQSYPEASKALSIMKMPKPDKEVRLAIREMPRHEQMDKTAKA